MNNLQDANMYDLQEKIRSSIDHFSEIKEFKVKDNFIQKKLDQISEQETEFRKFVEDFNHKMYDHADDLIIFAKGCEKDNIGSDEILESLGKLSYEKLNESKSELLRQIERVKNFLNEIVKEIIEYNENISDVKKFGTNHKGESDSLMRGSVMIVGIGTMIATLAVPFTGGTSVALVLPAAKLMATLGTSLAFQGMGTAVVSTLVVGATSIRENLLYRNLMSIKEQISQVLQKIKKILDDIDAIIALCESHFGKQIEEMECVETIVNGIKKLDDKQLIKPIARTISTRARRNSASYGFDIQKTFNKESTLPGIDDGNEQ